jgi:hypothetical protein
LAGGVQTIDPTERAGSLNPDSNYGRGAAAVARSSAQASVGAPPVGRGPRLEGMGIFHALTQYLRWVREKLHLRRD